MNPYVDDHVKCPSNHNNLECSSHGVSVDLVYNDNNSLRLFKYV